MLSSRVVAASSSHVGESVNSPPQLPPLHDVAGLPDGSISMNPCPESGDDVCNVGAFVNFGSNVGTADNPVFSVGSGAKIKLGGLVDAMSSAVRTSALKQHSSTAALVGTHLRALVSGRGRGRQAGRAYRYHRMPSVGNLVRSKHRTPDR